MLLRKARVRPRTAVLFPDCRPAQLPMVSSNQALRLGRKMHWTVPEAQEDRKS